MTFAAIFLLLLTFPAPTQQKVSALARERKEFADTIRELQAELRKSVDEYKAGLRQLLTVKNTLLEKQRLRLKQAEELYKESLISGREVNRYKEEVAETEAEVAKKAKELEDADSLIGELEDPDEIARRVITQPAKRERTPAGRVYYVRYLVIGEVTIYDYSGAVRGKVVRQGNRVRLDTRKR